MINYKPLLFSLILGATLSASTPNFIIISVDDMGYGDVGAYGSELVPTPKIDRLANNGVKATAGYVTSPVCGPSRYGMMSGAYQQRFGIHTNKDMFSNEPGDRVPRSHHLLPAILKESGYTTGLVGKWNLKSDARIWFDEVYSLMDWGADYFPDENGVYSGVWQRWPYDKASKDYGWGPVREDDEYLTDRLGREAVEFIEGNHEDPFFLYLAFNAPHGPLQAKKEHRQAVQHIETEPLQLYAAMLLSIDENVGNVLEVLDRKGITDNTFIVFVSDNGPSYAYNVGWPDHWEKELLGSANEFSGNKATFEEGGIRIPYIFHWPGGLPSGMEYDKPISTLDIYPTFCAIAGIEIPETTLLDGANLMPYLKEDKLGSPHENLYWYQGDRGALRSGDWKLLVKGGPELYDLQSDPGESENLAGQNPQLTNELFQRWLAFTSVMPLNFAAQYQEAKEAFNNSRNDPPKALHKIGSSDDDDDISDDNDDLVGDKLEPVLSTYVRSGSSRKNSISEERILVGYHDGDNFKNMRGWLEFDLSRIPDDKSIASVELVLDVESGTTGSTGKVGDLQLLDQGAVSFGSNAGVTWAMTNGGLTSGEVLSILEGSQKVDFANGQLTMTSTDALLAAANRARNDGKYLSLLLYSPESEDGQTHQFWRISADNKPYLQFELAD